MSRRRSRTPISTSSASWKSTGKRRSLLAETDIAAIVPMKTTLTDFENIAKALSVRISYDDLRKSRGGSCRVRETRRIIINKHLSNSEKINLLARELGTMDLAGLDLPDRVRKKIEMESDHQLPGA
jgi:hypothetical protein